MKRRSRYLKWLAALVLVFMVLQTVSCGTILYPHRRGARHSGDLDPKVVIMDAVGLVFFIIPGLVAYIVDFYTGAIYLGPGEKAWGRFPDPSNLQVDPIYAARLDKATLESILSRHIGDDIDLSDEPVLVFTDDRTDPEALRSWLANAGMAQAQIH